RQFAGLGIDPSSPAALSARTDVAFRNAASEAGAATRARDAAKVLGMSLTSDRANFARGGASGVLQAAGAAGGASGAGATGAAQAGQVAPGGAGNVNTGFGLAGSAFGNNLSAYTSLGKTSLESSASSGLAGLGALAGQLGSAAITRSDRRLKTAATRIVTLAHDIGLWAFRYLWEPDTAPLHYGFMADEVEPVFPDAVITGPDGYKMVDYGKVPV
ncbi:MAG: tail fiber domain-containing protein, partial [Acidobacteria bacterium]